MYNVPFLIFRPIRFGIILRPDSFRTLDTTLVLDHVETICRQTIMNECSSYVYMTLGRSDENP